jgi:hypothetical protein
MEDRQSRLDEMADKAMEQLKEAIDEMKPNLEQYINSYEVPVDFAPLKQARKERKSNDVATYKGDFPPGESEAKAEYWSSVHLVPSTDTGSGQQQDYTYPKDRLSATLGYNDKLNLHPNFGDSPVRRMASLALMEQESLKGKINLILENQEGKQLSFPLEGSMAVTNYRKVGSGPYVAKMSLTK